jgi:hypothetical protein
MPASLEPIGKRFLILYNSCTGAAMKSELAPNIELSALTNHEQYRFRSQAFRSTFC